MSSSTSSFHVPTLAQAGVMIVGGTAGVGLAAAIQLAAAGARRLTLVGRNGERGERARARVLAECPEASVTFVGADANRVGDAVAAVERATTAMGTVDVLVNTTPAPVLPTPFHEIPIADIEATCMQLLLAPMLMCSAVMPGMRARRGGAIINVASDAGRVGTPGESVIGAAMAGIIGFGRGLALEAKRSGIRVNTLTPSLIEGTLTYDRVMSEPFSAKIFRSAAAQAHLGVARPEDLAGLIVLLASPQGARITGQVISVNGGTSSA
jgi:NAD(P)-dependent dehydrogenase (short-subunit alcohol dehydrogenase family)